MAVTRITGTYSGFDTDKIIKDLMKVERTKVDKVYKQKQQLEWKRDNYREISSSLISFSDEYFDILKSSTNFRQGSSFSKFSIQSSDNSVAVTANSDAEKKTHNITVVSLASAARIEGEANVTDPVKGSNTVNYFSLSDQNISVTLDGVTKTIGLENYANMDELDLGLEQKLKDAFGEGKFDVVTTDGTVEVKLQLSASTFSLSGAGLSSLGFAEGDNTTNRLSLSSSLDSIKNLFKNDLDISDPNENVTFTINSKTISVGKTYAQATIRDVMNAINSSDSGTRMTYNSLQNNFVLESKTEGVASEITYTDSSSGLLKSLGIVDGTNKKGTDAEFTLDGVEGIKRSSNQFTIDDVSYSLKGISASPVSISIQPDIDAVVKNIKGFVEKYNSLLSQINGKLSEKYDRDYLPLTDEEKDAMEESDIEKWEARAKTGLLANDSILSKIVSSMRTALYEKVEGVSISLYDMGISSSSYSDKGKLKIDETKLKNALSNNFDQVVKLFTKESDQTYKEGLESTTKRTERYKESGLAQRIYDIIQDNVRTIRDSGGKKGALLERAGYTNDASEFKNFLYEQISAKDTMIDSLEDKLSAKETAYYLKFSNMEKLLGQMQSQASSISSITG